MSNKVIIFSAPSGAGKSTVVNHLLGMYPELEFSISATSRAPRGQEQHGVEYYFFTSDEFRQMIAEDKFVEYEEVYAGSFYGTLRSEVERIWAKGHTIIFDIDVQGGVNLKRIFAKDSSVAELTLRKLSRRGLQRLRQKWSLLQASSTIPSSMTTFRQRLQRLRRLLVDSLRNRFPIRSGMTKTEEGRKQRKGGN